MMDRQWDKTAVGCCCTYLSPRIRSAVQALGTGELRRLQEIRLRAGRPLSVRLDAREYFLMESGCLTDRAVQGALVTRGEIEETFRAVCEYSVYRYARELKEGYIPLRGGIRVGLAGTAVYESGVLMRLRDVGSLNFRIPMQRKHCADRLAEQTLLHARGGLLLLGEAGAGKTTMLRDLCRIAGDRQCVSLIDTRGEIAGVCHGIPQYEVGTHTDIFDGFPRSEGAFAALRAMTPSYLVCDEISTPEDADALLHLHGCGVSMMATAHAGRLEDAAERPVIRALLDAGVFAYVVMLGSGRHQGEIQQIRQVKTEC